MYGINFDPEAGDLGRAHKIITVPELHIITPHICNMLFHISRAGMRNVKYAFEFTLEAPSLIVREMNDLAVDFLEGVQWYTTEDGRKLFELRGQSGGVAHAYICYLIAY